MSKETPKKKAAEDFVKAYEELCKEYGFQITVVPNFRARDDGTWSVVLQTSVTQLQR